MLLYYNLDKLDILFYSKDDTFLQHTLHYCTQTEERLWYYRYCTQYRLINSDALSEMKYIQQFFQKQLHRSEHIAVHRYLHLQNKIHLSSIALRNTTAFSLSPMPESGRHTEMGLNSEGRLHGMGLKNAAASAALSFPSICVDNERWEIINDS